MLPIGISRRKANWYDGAEAAWIAKGAGSKEAALLDVTGNGNHLTYANYDSAGWANATGWAGLGSPNYFDTGVVPSTTTIYAAISDVISSLTNQPAIAMAETIAAFNTRFYIYAVGGAGKNSYYLNTQAGQPDGIFTGVLAMNNVGIWQNGVRLPYGYTWNASSAAWTIPFFLLTVNADGSPSATSVMRTGHLAAACISQKTDPDYVVKARSIGMLQLLRKTIT